MIKMICIAIIGVRHERAYPGHSWHIVVGQRGHVVLQHLGILSDDVSSCPILLITLQLVVGLYNVGQFVRQIILNDIKRR